MNEQIANRMSVEEWVPEKVLEYSARQGLFVIMFEKMYWPIGPFESWAAADEYGMTVIERSFNSGNKDRDEWKIRLLQPPKGRGEASSY